MTKRKRNRSSGATAALALISAGLITVGTAVKETIPTPLMIIAIVVLLVYIYKIKGRR